MSGTTTYFGVTYPTSTDYVKDGATAIQTVATGFDSAVAIPTYNAQTGATYTFALTDIGKVVTASTASGQTYTIPPTASVTWPTNTTLNVVSLGAGTVTFAAGAGVTVTNTAQTLSQYASASLIRTGLNAWTVVPFGAGATPLADSAISGTTGSPTTTTFTDGGINYKAYAFTGAGTITFTKAGLVDALVIAGGGGGGMAENATAGDAAAGGGAGGYRCTVTGESSGGGAVAESQLLVGIGTYYANVGAGGAGQSSAAGFTNGVNGSNSNFAFLTSVGGGGGGAQETAGSLGGSGGGGGGGTTPAGGAGTSSQGFAGGPGISATRSGGGGGGAAEIGSTDAAREGGDGVASLINGTTTTRGGGGGGGVGSNGTSTATGGSGGGGTGGASNSDNATAGTANTGGGGGGGGAGKPSYNGGSGIVIVRVLA